ncbi:MAG: hypothetical protein AVDCRST_MAG07-965, partial [uncultured Frankineae bacterium]
GRRGPLPPAAGAVHGRARRRGQAPQGRGRQGGRGRARGAASAVGGRLAAQPARGHLPRPAHRPARPR